MIVILVAWLKLLTKTPLKLLVSDDICVCCCIIYLLLLFAAYDGTVRKKLKFDGNHRDKTDQPVYEIPPEKYSANKIIAILLTAKPEEVCRHKPLNIKKSSTFVVDVWCLKNQEDIKKDEFGIWQYSGSHPQCFYVRQKDDGYIDIEKHEAGEINNSHVMYLRRLHCVHPSNSNFKRLICFLSGQYCRICCIFCCASIELKNVKLCPLW